MLLKQVVNIFCYLLRQIIGYQVIAGLALVSSRIMVSPAHNQLLDYTHRQSIIIYDLIDSLVQSSEPELVLQL